MRHTTRAAGDLADAAAVHAAREEIVQALGPLAARPLDEQATSMMRNALERAESPVVRDAIRRLAKPGERRRTLAAVATPADDTDPAAPAAQGLVAAPRALAPYAPGGAA